MDYAKIAKDAIEKITGKKVLSSRPDPTPSAFQLKGNPQHRELVSLARVEILVVMNKETKIGTTNVEEHAWTFTFDDGVVKIKL